MAGDRHLLLRSDPERTFQFAKERAGSGRNSRGKIKKPFVLGAVLNLKGCLDLSDSSAITQLKQAHCNLSKLSGVFLPLNTGGLRASKPDYGVINSLHQTRLEDGLPSYETVRGLF